MNYHCHCQQQQQQQHVSVPHAQLHACSTVTCLISPDHAHANEIHMVASVCWLKSPSEEAQRAHTSLPRDERQVTANKQSTKHCYNSITRCTKHAPHLLACSDSEYAPTFHNWTNAARETASGVLPPELAMEPCVLQWSIAKSAAMLLKGDQCYKPRYCCTVAGCGGGAAAAAAAAAC